MYEFAAIIRVGESPDGQGLLPEVTSEGSLALEPGEEITVSLQARSLELYRGQPIPGHHYFKLTKSRIEVVATSTRLLVLCRKYEKGGVWFGNPLLALLATVISKSRAAMRRHGKVLAGHMRLRWLSELSCNDQRRHYSLSLTALDEEGAAVTARLGFDRHTSPRPLAEQLLAAAGAIHLGETGHLDNNQREALRARFTLPEQTGRLPATVTLPGALPARPENAYPPPAVPR